MMIEVSNLIVRYGQTRAVNNLSLAIAPGENVLLAGANGAGKTTLPCLTIMEVSHDRH